MTFRLANCVRPSSNTNFLGELVIIKGHIKNFQPNIKVNIPIAAIGAFKSLKIRCRKIDHSVPPSILAASINSSGIDREFCFMKKIPKLVTNRGSIIPK